MPTRKSAASSSKSSSNHGKKQQQFPPPPPPMVFPPQQPTLIHSNHPMNHNFGPTPVPVQTTSNKDPLLALAGVADDELSDLMYEEVADMILKKTKGKSTVEKVAFLKKLLEGTDFKTSFERRMENEFPVLDNILNGTITLEKKKEYVEMEIIDD